MFTLLNPSETVRMPGVIPKEFFLPGPRSTTVLFSSDSVTTATVSYTHLTLPTKA